MLGAAIRKAAADWAPQDDRWYSPGGWYYGGTETSDAGIEITADSAMQLSMFFACTKVLSEDVAQLPLIYYRRIDRERKERAWEERLYTLLHDQPNRFQNSFEWREMKMGHLILRGNSYDRMMFDRRGNLEELIPLHPDKVTPKLKDGELVYEYREYGTVARPKTFMADEIFHLRGMSSDGITGVSILTHARNAMGIAAATERYGSHLFKNRAEPGVILKHPRKLTPDVQERLRASWDARHSGSEGYHRTAVLEEGMTVEKMGMTAEDAQFI